MSVTTLDDLAQAVSDHETGAGRPISEDQALAIARALEAGPQRWRPVDVQCGRLNGMIAIARVAYAEGWRIALEKYRDLRRRPERITSPGAGDSDD